jgi:hypothetical protein
MLFTSLQGNGMGSYWPGDRYRYFTMGKLTDEILPFL